MFFSKKYKVIVKNKNITVEAKSGSKLFQVLKDNNIPIQSLCSGDGQCGKCKVKITSVDGKEINKPTKKDRLMIALVNLDAGYRLACEYTIKQDIIVDTEEWIIRENYNPEIVGVKKSEKQVTKDKQIESDNVNTTDSADEESTNNTQSSTGEIEKKSPPIIKEEHSISDGLILIQFNTGIKYYFFSSGIDNISHSGTVKTSETLVNLIDDNTVSDFIYENIKVPDFERIIFVLEKPHFEGKNLLDIVNYYSFELGSVFCEVIQPINSPRQLTSFFRLTSNLKNNSLILSLDSLSSAHYVDSNGVIYNIDLRYITDEYGFEDLFFLEGKNPILEVSEDFGNLKIKEPLVDPDSLTITAKLQALRNMLLYGIINNDFSFNERQSLMDKIPIEILVKISQIDDKKIFYIYRKKGVSLYIDEDFIEKIKYLKVILNSLFEYIETNYGKIQNISINSFINFENLINNLLDINIIPKKYSKKVSFFTGDPTVLAAKFFSMPTIENYTQNKIKETLQIKLHNDNSFSEIFNRNLKTL
ncbi:2Fe-2S iron-sulfur cluster binding domain-containing protein [Deferribacterales bacterium Es71-Z0220]|uniref:2Fe-2S iron-sulfur cluster-binding protein n=1 Tax=Deferrivibrio essentukiensis TaxID=2880922 RepID=UPI001F60B344|nr:2Fe-2S iron-sulfur cluster-binding protein [Deferrivibrio essentukiensis]MCB4204082.1 2Fe-2S iron-sulfur cluster binding domain-containing protein [Deferrivibrio essentukiensis]